jgi:hypothetical protein
VSAVKCASSDLLPWCALLWVATNNLLAPAITPAAVRRPAAEPAAEIDDGPASVWRLLDVTARLRDSSP